MFIWPFESPVALKLLKLNPYKHFFIYTRIEVSWFQQFAFEIMSVYYI